MLAYYVLYRTDEKTRPTGIFVMGSGGHALIWDHRQKAWSYNPSLVVRIVDDYRNFDRYETVDRETVERIAPQVTGGEQVPDEESIHWVFQWEGNPPQNED